ncbi:Polyketide cyclase / dehydrase and lipid transport [Rhodoblastus acidophilus]|uniref:Polyketide cyclase / dehydrase and lipid transport n=1 Tax=Rhodoblastus acidophilus TaxID=1074 RepID=A0A212S839_RHOAC|nr:SRPBCC family protein [Rhodoblastus acidophilus]PPQ37027.1 SRPBCC family protein [Rhodoblastus acidophilus]RAI20334.1 SRPBCC family protein [Rhodoblastus acidophilus]SNB81511.1 Polyketide cyclase / dehydrase and lipid transport [Rhodoblastus acidophilus]
MKALALAAAVLAIATGAATAHGPTRQKIVETVEIDKPVDKIWAVIGDFDALAKWHPAIASSVADKGNSEGSVRHLVLKAPGDPSFDEVLDKYDASAHSYKYEIPKVDPKILPVNNYTSTISVLDNGKGGSTVEWKGAFYRGYMLNDPPPELNDEASAKAVRGVYRAGLDNLKKLVETTN